MLLANDPLFVGDVDLAVVLIVVIKTVIVFAFLLIATMLMIWFERKIIGDMQNRIGPNRAGPFGLLQSLADGVKAFFKEDLIPDRADRLVFKLAPYLSLLPALITFSVVPIGGTFSGDEHGVVEHPRPRHVPAAGRPAHRHPAGAGDVVDRGLRRDARRLVVRARSTRCSARCGRRRRWCPTRRPWACRSSPWCWSRARSAPTASSPAQTRLGLEPLDHRRSCPFVIFLIAGTAEVNRPPFDLVEAEQELVGGFNTEYSGIRFAIFYLAEFMSAITFAAVITTLFLGGPAGPELFGPDIDVGPDLVLREGHLPAVLLRVGAGHAAPPPLRPADGPRVEGADPAVARLAAAARRPAGRRRRGLVTGDRRRRGPRGPRHRLRVARPRVPGVRLPSAG